MTVCSTVKISVIEHFNYYFMRHPKLFSFIAALGLGACVSAFAQTTSPLPGPFPADPTPKPFDYPQGLSTPQFTLEQNPASVIQFGDFPIVLGVTPLSVVTKAFGGTFIIYPIVRTTFAIPLRSKKPRSLRKGQEKPVEDEVPPPEVIGQNIWFIIGERGEVSEAKAEAVTTEGELCPALPEAFSSVSFGPFRIGVNLKPKEIKNLKFLSPVLPRKILLGVIGLRPIRNLILFITASLPSKRILSSDRRK